MAGDQSGGPARDGPGPAQQIVAGVFVFAVLGLFAAIALMEVGIPPALKYPFYVMVALAAGIVAGWMTGFLHIGGSVAGEHRIRAAGGIAAMIATFYFLLEAEALTQTGGGGRAATLYRAVSVCESCGVEGRGESLISPQDALRKAVENCIANNGVPANCQRDAWLVD